MPMKNAAAFVRAAVDSVLAEQTVRLEIVVVDDGSTDDSRSIVQAIGDERVLIVAGPCRGVSASFNAGFAAASGNIIMCCDADDLYEEGRIRIQVAWLRENPAFDAVCGRFSTIDSKGVDVASLVEAPAQSSEEEITDELLSGTVRTHFCTFAIKRYVFELVGLQREYFETAQDIDLQLRMSLKARIGFLPRSFYRYRLHDASITHQQANGRRRFFEATAFLFHSQRVSGSIDSLAAGDPPAPPPPTDIGGFAMGADDQIFGMIVGTAWTRFGEGRLASAIATGSSVLWRYPFRAASWRFLVTLCAKSLAFRIGFKP